MIPSRQHRLAHSLIISDYDSFIYNKNDKDIEKDANNRARCQRIATHPAVPAFIKHPVAHCQPFSHIRRVGIRSS